ncbi:MAG: hypothetical protein B7W97_01715 [Mycobacterium sp. 20-66-4]|nr:MAG: hypothetical protein B7W97_01715 [Mycobacterium sp. 20-66-4]
MHRFRAGIAEEHPVGECAPSQLVRQPLPGRRTIEIRRVNQPALHRLLHRARESGIGVSERVYRDPGDEIARDIELPADIRPGDLLAVACTGAYHHSMSSSSNLIGRPPLISVADGRSRALVRRETIADLLARDCGWAGHRGTAPVVSGRLGGE